MFYTSEVKREKKTAGNAFYALASLFMGFALIGGMFNGLALLGTQEAHASSVPTITLIGSNPVTLNQGDTYTEPGYTANDAEDGDLTGSVNVNDGGLDTNTPGTYTITYSVTDADANTVSATRTVIVNSINTAPAITLVGATSITLNQGDTYTEPGYTANDTQEGDLTGSVMVNDGGLNTSVAGTYTLTYSVTDAGSLTDSKTRTVIVNAPAGNTAPVITLIGSNLVSLTVGSAYTEPGYTASDTEDGDLTGSVNVNDGGLDTNTSGTYTITYSVTDAGGLTDSKTRTVVVNAAGGGNTAPIITLIGANPVNLTVGATYTEPGYTASDAEEGDVTGLVNVNNGGLDTSVVGTYTLTYSVSDTPGLTDTKTRVVNVTSGGGGGGTPPVTPPCTACGGGGSSNFRPDLYIHGDLVVKITTPDKYVEPGYVAEDREDGIITDKVVIDYGGLDVNAPAVGEYTLTYNVSDSTGWAAKTGTRKVVVTQGGGNGPTTPTTPTATPSTPETPQQCDYLFGFSRINNNTPGENDPVEVRKVQFFMNVFEGANIEVNGVFGPDTDTAVRAFQSKYKVDILDPWSHTAPTGYVYLTTRKKINEIYCNREFPLTVSQLQEIDAFSQFLANARANTPASTTVGDTGAPSVDLSDTIRADEGIIPADLRLDEDGNPLIGLEGVIIDGDNLAAALESDNLSTLERAAVNTYNNINNMFNRFKRDKKAEDNCDTDK